MNNKYFKLVIVLIILITLFYTLFSGNKISKADITIALDSEPRTLDPALNTALASGRIIDVMFEGLTVKDPKTMRPIPALAKSWEISDSGKTYKFKIRKAFWSNGDRIRAQDFVWSWKRVLTPSTASEYMYQLFYLKNSEKFYKDTSIGFDKVGVKAENDSTLIVNLEYPVSYILDIFAFSTTFPINKNCYNKYKNKWTRPENIVVSGPFIPVHHQLNFLIRLEKNKTYWDKENVKSNSINALTMEGVSTAFNMYETGDLDIITTVPTLIVEELKKRNDYYSYPVFGTYFYRINIEKEPMNNVKVRKALTMAIDKESIVKNVTKGGQLASSSLMPIGINGYTQAKGPAYNPKEARDLLAEAGYANGKGFPDIELLYNTNEGHKKIAEAISYMWKKELNIDIKPHNLEWKVFLDHMSKKDYSIMRSSWYGDYYDPNTFLDMFVKNGGNNRTNWHNAKYDSLINLCLETSGDVKRYEYFNEAENILVNIGLPIIPIYNYTSQMMFKKDLKGIYPNVMSYINLKYIYKEKQ